MRMKIANSQMAMQPEQLPSAEASAKGAHTPSRLEALGISAMLFAAALILFGCIAFTYHANRILALYDDNRRVAEISATLLNVYGNIHAMEAGRQGNLASASEDSIAPLQQGGLELRKNLGLLDNLVPQEDVASKALVGKLRTLTASWRLAGAMPQVTDEAIAKDAAFRQQVQAAIADLNAHFRMRQTEHDNAVQRMVEEAKYLMLLWMGSIAGGFGLALRYGAKARKILRHESRKLAMVANHDNLTGLPNRRYLNEHLATSIALAGRSRVPFCLLYIDLDGFSDINNTFGHEAGDAALVWASNAVRAEIRRSDFFARLGGDEFVIVSQGATLTQAEELAARLLARFEAGKAIEQVATGALGLSIGIAGLQANDTRGETLLARADQAMYAAKHAGKRCWRVAGHDLHQANRSR